MVFCAPCSVLAAALFWLAADFAELFDMIDSPAPRTAAPASTHPAGKGLTSHGIQAKPAFSAPDAADNVLANVEPFCDVDLMIYSHTLLLVNVGPQPSALVAIRLFQAQAYDQRPTLEGRWIGDPMGARIIKRE